MSITVRLIFMGLIGFAPHDDGRQGMTALFLDTARMQSPSAQCPVPSHIPVVYMLDGKCTGECERVPHGREDDADSMGFNNPNHPLQLAWLLDKEDLEISQVDQDAVRLARPFFFQGRRRLAPRRSGQTSYFSWVPDMQQLTGGYGKVREDCLGDQGTCPLTARFKLTGGEASTCHLFHDLDDQPSPDGKSTVRVFDYTIEEDGATRVVSKQAVADAVLVEFEVEGDRVTLDSWELPMGQGQQAKKGTAHLWPAENSRTLTLIVAYLPSLGSIHPQIPQVEGVEGEAHHDAGCEQSHAEVLFDLLAREQSPRPVRTLNEKETMRVSPGSCEPEVLRIAALLQGEPPHSTTACSGTRFGTKPGTRFP